MCVLLLELPQLLRDLLEHAVQGHSDCRLLKETIRASDGLVDQRVAPDIVILGLTATDDATIVPALFARWPRVQVMTVMPAGKDAVVYELQPRVRALGPMSPAEIVTTLYERVHHRDDVVEE